MPYKNKFDQSINNKKWRIKNRERDLQRQRDRHHKIRREILTYYSNGKISCACCEENIVEFLSIDHIDGGGTAQKKNLKTRDVYAIIDRIKRESGSYPLGYRVLCHNCNQAIGFYGSCPHMRK